MAEQSGNGGGGFGLGLLAGGAVLVGAVAVYVFGDFGADRNTQNGEAAQSPETVTTEQAEATEATPAEPQPEPPVDDASEPADTPIAVIAAQPDKAPTTTDQRIDADEPTDGVAQPELTDAVEAEAAPATPPVPVELEEPRPLTAPTLDVIRVASDGAVTLAGSAPARSSVDVLLDGQSVHAFEIDRSGQFAVFFDIPYSDLPRVLSLRAALAENEAQSEDFVISALPEPVVVATPAPQPDLPAQNEEEPASPDSDQEADADVAQVAAVTPGVTSQATPAEVPTGQAVTASPSPAEASPSEPANVSAPQPAQPPSTEPVSSVPEVAKVPAESTAPVVLKSGAEGVELVQAPEAAAPGTGLALDTIGYSTKGEVQLTGRSGNAVTVRVYLNNRPLIDLSAGGDGRWRGELSGIEPGIYTLRLDELNSAGAVVNRIETPFKREAPDVLQPLSTEAGVTAQAAPIRAVTVQKGDTLWAISRDRYGDGVLYVKVFDANRENIRNPDLIYPGQIFTLPD